MAARVTAPSPHFWKQSKHKEEAQKVLIYYRLQRKQKTTKHQQPAPLNMQGEGKDHVKQKGACAEWRTRETTLTKSFLRAFCLLKCNWVILWPWTLKAEGIKAIDWACSDDDMQWKQNRAFNNMKSRLESPAALHANTFIKGVVSRVLTELTCWGSFSAMATKNF